MARKEAPDELSRMNGLKAPMPKATMVNNLGNLGATVKPLVPSNDPGPMTSPSSQGPTFPGSKQAHK